MSNHPAPFPHGPIQELVPDIYWVRGSIRMAPTMRINRVMTILRQDDELTLLNAVRLNPEGEEELLKLGTIKRVIRVGYFHGLDDPYYVDTFGAEFWASPGKQNFERPAVDVEITADTALPVDGASFFVFEKTRKPEVAVLVEREGGILLTCDSVQHWPDTSGCSLTAKLAMQFMGFKHPATIGPPWRKAMTPKDGTLEPDFRRMLELPFDTLLASHGGPLRGGAKAALRASVERVF